MSAIGNLLSNFKMGDPEDEYYDEEDDFMDDEYEDDNRGSSYKKASRNNSEDERSAKRSMSKVTSINRKKLNTESGNIFGIKPKSMEDAKLITDTLLEGKIVVLNIESTNSDIAERILDFSMGTTYALNGIMQRISSSIYIIVPYGIEISGAFQEYMSSSDQ